MAGMYKKLKADLVELLDVLELGAEWLRCVIIGRTAVQLKSLLTIIGSSE